MSGSRIFRRNRAVGYVSNNIPAVTRYVHRRKDNLIITCIGRAFQVYTAGHFRLLHISDVHPDEITCLAADKRYIFTASDKAVYAWRSGKHLKHLYKGHDKDVHLLLPFRDHLITVDEGNTLRVWSVVTEDIYLEIPFNEKEFKISAMMHPPTYINKILLGSSQGTLQLWNIKDNKLVYTFNTGTCRVTALEAAPVIDVAGIGFVDGRIVLLNMKYDEIIVEFKQEWGPVLQMSFRTDGNSILATTSTNGNVAFWNLEERRVASQLVAHHDNVTTAICLPSEPLMLTTSPDNSMKLWIFDLPDGGARLLRIREGHSAPPLCIRFHGSKGENIISSGEDSSMRIFSTISETLNKSMGRASYNRKASKKKNKMQEDPLIMPPILHFTTETTREKEWDNIAAIHAGLVQTTTWSFDKCRMGHLKLVPEKFHNKTRTDFISEATCVALTHCGNFVIIGYSSGDVERFNIQSGIHRASYGKPAHKSAVRGIACDNLNQMVITGASDGILKFWNFRENVSEPISEMDLHQGVSMFHSHRESAMLCIALEDFTLNILDCDTKTVVRKFVGHTGKINDVTFSPDSRRLISAAMDSTIKIWDIPSSYMIDHFKVERPCVSLTMSPTGEFLATAHVDYLGIYLWANKMLFNQISLRSIDPYEDAPYIDLPSHSRDQEANIEDAMAEINLGEGDELTLKYETPEQLDDDLVTMSDLAASRWQNLLDLDIIKKRNKPKAPPKVPKQAPFFLPTVAGTEFQFDLSGVTQEDENSRVLIPENFSNLTIFGKMLQEAINTGDHQSCVDHLKKVGPSMIDFEIKSLHPDGGGNYKIMLQFLRIIVFMLNTNKDFELAQAYLSVFLKVHGRSLTENNEIMDYLPEVQKAQNKSWDILEEKLLYGLGVVSALRNYVR